MLIQNADTGLRGMTVSLGHTETLTALPEVKNK